MSSPIRTSAITDVLSFVIVVMLFVISPSLAGDPGVGWHLKIGEWVAEHNAAPRVDPFLAHSGDRPFFANQWLADLILWWLHRTGGWPLLSLFCFALPMVPFVLLLPRASSLISTSAVARGLGFTLAFGIASLQWFIRPLVFSFFFFTLLYYLLLETSRLSRAAFLVVFLLAVPALFGVWANLHPGFPLGLFLLLLASASAVLQREWRQGLILAGSIALAIVVIAISNPYGATLFESIGLLVGDPYFMNLNNEWKSPDFHAPLLWPTLIVVSLLTVVGTVGTPLFVTLSCVVFATLALIGVRYNPFFGVVVFVPLTMGVDRLLRAAIKGRVDSLLGTIVGKPAQWVRPGPGIVPAAILGVSLVSSAVTSLPFLKPEQLSIERGYPAKAVDVLAAQDPGALLNDPNWGGYLVFRLYPRWRPFIDDRNEINGRDRYEEYFSMTKLRADWRAAFDRYQFRYVLLHPDSALVTMLSSTGEFAELYRDSTAVLLARATVGNLNQPRVDD